jgi:integrase
MLAKITKSVVDRLQPGSMVWDTQLIGYGVRKQRRSAFYLIRYRINGRQRFLSIGRNGAFTPDTARREATRLLGIVASGTDPALVKEKSEETFGAELEKYLDRKRSVLRPRSMIEIERYLQVQCKSLHNLPLAGIDRRTIALTLADIETLSGPVARNRARTSLSAFFAYAIKEGLIDGLNPVSGTGKATEGNGRERVLSKDELGRLYAGLHDDDPFSSIVKLLVLTGQRRNEIGGLRWAEVDFERGLIVFPPDRVKNGRQHELPMSSQVRAILERQPRNGEYVWGCQWSSWSEPKAKLDRRIRFAKSMTEWRLHDLRRTATTIMADLGILPHILEAILNHVSGHKSGVAGIYNRARYEGEMRAALQLWGDYVDSLRLHN